MIHRKAFSLTQQDYYPFGMLMPGRHGRLEKVSGNWTWVNDQQGGYRHGFNGMEWDNEVKGKGNSYDFGARIYDPRLGRWLSLDPLMKKYPSESNYSFTSNSPILFYDHEGKDRRIYVYMINEEGTKIKVGEQKFVNNEVQYHWQHTYEGTSSLYATDVMQEAVYDVRTGKATISEVIADYNHRTAVGSAAGKSVAAVWNWMGRMSLPEGSEKDNLGPKGWQTDGFRFESEFAKTPDGANTNSKYVSGIVNIDDIMLAVKDASQSLHANDVAEAFYYVIESMKVANDAVKKAEAKKPQEPLKQRQFICTNSMPDSSGCSEAPGHIFTDSTKDGVQHNLKPLEKQEEQ